MNQLWDLPDVLLFRIVSFVACPTHRASVICHQIAPLSKLFANQIDRKGLWETILKEDYGSDNNHNNQGRHSRSSKRLRRSPLCRVKEAHKLVKDNTEIAYFYLSEMTANQDNKKLTKASFLHLLKEFGPHLRYNQTLSTGGIFLVEVCRAKHSREQAILQCVQELVEHRGALVNASTSESNHQHMTALTVAAARGMCKVVQYLVSAGADLTQPSSGRFQLHSNPRRSVGLRNKCPVEFCSAMIEEETRIDPRVNVTSLRRCLTILEQAEARREERGRRTD